MNPAWNGMRSRVISAGLRLFRMLPAEQQQDLMKRYLQVRGRLLRGKVGTLLERRGTNVIHCFGDSHVLVFRQIGRRGLMPRTIFDVVEVGGATALGLANPNSRTAALHTFGQTIANIPQSRFLLFMLGEVDCGYLIWYRAEKLGIPVAEQMGASLDHYEAFLEALRSSGRRRILVCAVPAPTIEDGQEWGEVAKARREVKASLLDRTQLTKRYNAELRQWCVEHGIAFLDYETELLDESTGLVRKSLRNADPLDHHLAADQFSRIASRELARALSDGGR